MQLNETDPADLNEITTSKLTSKMAEANLQILKLRKDLESVIYNRDYLLGKLKFLLTSLDSRDSVGFSGFHPAESASSLLLSATQRLDIWNQMCEAFDLDAPWRALGPHDGYPGARNILICASGGIGDIILVTPLAEALHEQFGARIFVVHTHKATKDILDDNVYIAGHAVLTNTESERFTDHLSRLDIFDLLVLHRYATLYLPPPKSRIPADFLRIAHMRGVEWNHYALTDWPHDNNTFAKKATAGGFGLLDLTGFTGNLPVSQTSSLYIMPSPPAETVLGDLRGRYVTVHHGADPHGTENGLQTKNMSMKQWEEIVSLLKQQGQKTVQIGANTEDLIKGVSIDLRGKLSLRESAYVIKHAACHIDTEGGLVHIARAVHRTAMVIFGPTSAPFFGYPQNENIAPAKCGDCWSVTRDWMSNCPRSMRHPECMVHHQPATIVEKVSRLARPVAPAYLDTITRAVDWTSTIDRSIKHNRILLLSTDWHKSANASRLSPDVYDRGIHLNDWPSVPAFDNKPAIPFSNAQIHAASGIYPMVIIEFVRAIDISAADLLLDALRVVSDKGRVIAALDASQRDALFDVLKALENADRPLACQLYKRAYDDLASIQTDQIIITISKSAPELEPESKRGLPWFKKQ
ncbi:MULTISPECIES: glycosyltransferase family 9 protein [unclassified Beijerinckia]|uniref:glycosyltransferase family 9 protein n=1 Tax=unclassified Beijerinckia TaxID=2638183 RepID=UPI000896E632|nr:MULTISPECIES: glycosyltransferase family 9 protein [unclassified Beijerinckia]MDH7795548.1 ADP-heptose:LPS heptosyltransferase [Beijerinckia sp. GAS462]SEC06114.1 ADP-heptose:LPS heptosyltransferase [Beijerinckia sp. 28-YEA-48]